MYQQPLTYHPSMRRGGFQPIVAPMYTSRYMAQAATPPPQGATTAPTPAPVPPPAKKMSTPLALGLGAGGGALAGYLLHVLLPKRIQQVPQGHHNTADAG